nr:MAG TPA: restriction alleviation protein [Caudoviricetes sp.]
MFTERVKQAALRFVNECNAHPRPCPYCGEIPEVVEEAIYPGEKHCYVVCNGAKLLPHSISIHGRTREEAAAHWNSFVLTMKSQEK